jgi:hypothetical protein
MPYPDSEQLPKRGYTIQAIPLRALAAAAVAGSLGLTYPDSEQLPKRGYALGSVPLRALAHAAVGGGSLGITYPDREQATKRSYVLGSVPLRSLARAAVSSPVPPTPIPDDGYVVSGGTVLGWAHEYPDARKEKTLDDDKEAVELAAIIAYCVNVWQRNV